MSKINIYGLGSSTIDAMTVGVLNELKSSNHVYTRTMDHPAIQELETLGVAFTSFDEVYETHEQLGMNESLIIVRNYLCTYSCRKGAATQHAQWILGISESITGYLVITRATGNEGMDYKCMYLSMGIYRW